MWRASNLLLRLELLGDRIRSVLALRPGPRDANLAPEASDVKRLSPSELLGPLNDVEARHAPDVLYVAGRTGLLAAALRVAVVGSRRASPQGIAAAQQVAVALARRGFTVVSGLAEGIDTAAHLAAMRSGGRTIAVLGTPLDRAFPASNRGLQAEIASDHLAISQFPPGTRTQPAHFVLRNRTMALVSCASVLIEAGESSGTLHQGWEMLRLGRPVYLHPLVLGNPRLRWPEKMLDHGARPFDAVEDLDFEVPHLGVDVPSGAPF